MDAESNITFGGPSPARHDFFHFRTSTFNNRQTSYLKDNGEIVKLLEFENSEVQDGTYTSGCQNKYRWSWGERGSSKMFSDSKMPTLEPQVSEVPGNGNWNERTGASESFCSRIRQHSRVRLGKSLSETVSNNIRNVFYESLKKEDKSSVRNSFNISNDLGESQNSSPDSTDQNSSCRSTTLGISDVEMSSTNGEETATMGNTTKEEPSPCTTTVKLRNKRPANEDITTSWPSPQIDLMKRRSVEIAELRHALEKKISNRRPKSEPCTISKRPKSAYKYLDGGNDPAKENNVPSPTLQNGNFCSYTSGTAGLRQHSAPSSTTDPRKLKYLMDDHIRNSPFGDQKIFGPFLCQRCSNPINFSPNTQRRTPTTLCDEGDDADSEYFTPQVSPGHKYFEPANKTQQMEDAETSEDPTQAGSGRVNYYPNCEVTIWIRSCTQEVIEPISGVHSGVIPQWLRGALIRNGPGRLQVGEEQYNHVFDGSALLHRFHFKDGQVTYQNKFLKSRSYLKDTKAQRIVVNYFGTRAHPDPCRTILQNIASKFSFEEHFTDNAQISLYPYSDGLYALTETPFLFRVDPDTLNTHEKVNLTHYVSVFTHTAHPHVDRDGTVYNVGQGVGPMGPRYHICRFPKRKTNSKGKVKSTFDQAQVVGSVNARWRFNPCYMHSFAMTDNYWVIIEQPLVVSVAKFIKVIFKRDALIDALQWWEKETRIHVVRRDSGTVTCTQYVTETFFFLHTINAYEDRGHIVLDIAAYKNAEMLHCMYVEALKNASYDPTYAQMFRGRPKRWVIPLLPDKNAGRHTNLITLPGTQCHARWIKKNVVHVTPELLADIGCEVPRIHYEEYNGRFYRYFYAICSDVDHPNPGTLVKVDVVNKTHVEWSADNVYPSEPIFVPAPCSQREDEGVVLSALLRAKGLDQQVCLLVLDATTFTELGRVEFTAPGPVPKCLHGWFVQEGTLKAHPHQQDKEASQGTYL